MADIYIYAYVGIYIRCGGCSRFALKAASKVKVTRPESLALSRCRDYEVNVCQVGIRICRDEVRRDRVRELGARESVVQEEHVGSEHSPRGSISRFRKVWSLYAVGVCIAIQIPAASLGSRRWQGLAW